MAGKGLGTGTAVEGGEELGAGTRLPEMEVDGWRWPSVSMPRRCSWLAGFGRPRAGPGRRRSGRGAGGEDASSGLAGCVGRAAQPAKMVAIGPPLVWLHMMARGSVGLQVLAQDGGRGSWLRWPCVPGPTATVGIGSSACDSVLCAQPEGTVTDAALRLLWSRCVDAPLKGLCDMSGRQTVTMEATCFVPSGLGRTMC